MTPWAHFFNQKIKEIAKAKIILDVGSGRKFQKGLQPYQDLFKNCHYITLDKVAEYQPDILGDISHIPLADNSLGAIICQAVLEHIQNPQKAVDEIYRVLKPGGQCLVSLPFLYPYHAEKDYYGDFYRFTEDGVRYLFRKFSQIEICKIRGFFETIINLSPIRLIAKLGAPIARCLDKVFISKNQTSGYIVYLIK